MIKLKIKTTLKKMGVDSRGIIIPKPIANLLEDNKKYTFTISEGGEE